MIFSVGFTGIRYIISILLVKKEQNTYKEWIYSLWMSPKCLGCFFEYNSTLNWNMYSFCTFAWHRLSNYFCVLAAIEEKNPSWLWKSDLENKCKLVNFLSYAFKKFQLMAMILSKRITFCILQGNFKPTVCSCSVWPSGQIQVLWPHLFSVHLTKCSALKLKTCKMDRPYFLWGVMNVWCSSYWLAYEEHRNCLWKKKKIKKENYPYTLLLSFQCIPIQSSQSSLLIILLLSAAIANYATPCPA